MAKITIPGLRPKPTAAGIRYYWEPSATLKRAGWKPVALGMEQGPAIAAAQAKNAEVAAWRSGGQSAKQLQVEVQKFAAKQTLGALISKYRAERLPDLGAGTQKGYRTALDRIDIWAGDMATSSITSMNVQVLRDALMGKPAVPGTVAAAARVSKPFTALVGKKGLGHHAAFNVLKVGSTLFAWGKHGKRRYVEHNPFEGYDLAPPASRDQLWEKDDEGAFIAAAIAKGYPSMAFAAQLAIYTAQRSQDLIAFTENQLGEIHLRDPALTERFAAEGQANGNTVMGWTFTPSKSKTVEKAAGKIMTVPFDPKMLARVQDVLKAHRAIDRPKNRLISYVLVDDTTGLPWTQHGFIRAWQMILKHAVTLTGRTEMADLHWHDFRRTRVVRLRRRGMNREQIASLTGHSPKSIDAMLEVYGPVDSTMTASVIVAMIDHEEADEAAAQKRIANG